MVFSQNNKKGRRTHAHTQTQSIQIIVFNKTVFSIGKVAETDAIAQFNFINETATHRH